jgi:hypothetical protein
MDNLGKNWQLIIILFCDYRSSIHDPLSKKNASRNSASFKDSSVVGQNYQRAHQGCS